MGRYFQFLGENTNIYEQLNAIDSLEHLINSRIDSLQKKQYTSRYYKKKTEFFDFVDFRSDFFNDSKQEEKIFNCFSFLQFKDLTEIKEQPIYNYNIIGKIKDSDEGFILNKNPDKYLFKISSNGLKTFNNFFVYGYVFLKNGGKALLGFAFKDEVHYQNTFRKYINRIEGVGPVVSEDSGDSGSLIGDSGVDSGIV